MSAQSPFLKSVAVFWFISISLLSTTQAATGYASGECIQGIVCDGTPDYSESLFENLERIMAKYDPEKEDTNRDFENSAIYAMTTIAYGPHKPLPNVTVTLSAVPPYPGVNALHLITITDRLGKFCFSNVPRGIYYIEAKVRRGFLSRPFEIQKQVEHYRSYDTVNLVYYSQPANVRGRITDSSGHPLSSAKVKATQQNLNEEGTEFPSHIVSTLSARDGSYELRGLMPGNAYTGPVNYRIRVEKENYVTVETTIPVATEEVFAAMTRIWRILLKNSDQDGKARLAEMELKESPQFPKFSRNGTMITGIDLALGAPSTLRGWVVDLQNKPQPGCDVSLVPVKDLGLPLIQDVLIPKPVLTHAQGSFEFLGVPAGCYTFHIGKDNRWVNAGSTNFIIGEGQMITGLPLKIDLQPLSRIEASVRTKDTGMPVTNFMASVWGVSNPKEYSSTSGDVKMKPFGPGTFSVEKISPGKAELEITAPGYVTEHLHVNVPPGETVPLNVQMVKAGTANIRIIRDGTPLEPSENLQAFSMETDSVTYGRNKPKDGDGYELQGLKPGHYSLRAHVFEGQRCARYETAPAFIEAGKTSNVTLDFSGSSTLAISLSIPIDLRAQVWIEAADAPADQPFEKNLGMVASLWPKWSGTYEAKHLRPGTYRVCAKLIDSSKGKGAKIQLPPPQNQTIIIESGKTNAVAFRF